MDVPSEESVQRSIFDSFENFLPHRVNDTPEKREKRFAQHMKSVKHAVGGVPGRGLHSFAFQLNLSHF